MTQLSSLTKMQIRNIHMQPPFTYMMGLITHSYHALQCFKKINQQSTCTCAHTRARARARAHTRTHARTHVRTYTHMHTHACTHTYTRARTRPCPRACTHTRTYFSQMQYLSIDSWIWNKSISISDKKHTNIHIQETMDTTKINNTTQLYTIRVNIYSTAT